MIVNDLYEDIRSITNFTDQTLNFSRITDAVEVLNNKGEFDITLGYLDIPVGSNNLITLPREVDSVLKVNIDDNPSFSRDRLYEFTLNGPGSNTERVDFTWEDRGNVPTLVALPTNSFATTVQIGISNSDAADNGKQIIVTGRDANDAEVSVTSILSNAINPVTSPPFKEITRVYKAATVGTVDLYSIWVIGAPGTGNVVLSRYAPDETEPSYRQIRISKTGVTAHILFKRRNFKVTSLNDFIPIRSKMGLIYMIKSLEAYRHGNTELGDALEKTALDKATAEQKSHNAFIELSAGTESPTIRGLNYSNSDSVIVADIYDEVSKIKGGIGEKSIFDVITEAHEALANKSQWDGMTGAVDIITDQYHYVTLPRYVEAPVQINIEGRPTEMRNKWFEFHLNGPGSRTCCGCSTVWTDVGDVVTFRDVNYSQKLVAIPDLSSDISTVMRGFGRYQGKEIYTANPATGVMELGFPIEVNMSGATSSNQFVDVIERITKSQSNGFIKLLGFDSSRNLQNTIGYYWPDETEPNYRRIYIPQASAWVRVLYRRRTRKISSLTDPLHLRSKLAILTMVRAIDLLNQGKVAEADLLEKKAVQYMTDEQQTRNPSESFSFQVGVTDGADRIGNIV